MYATRIRIKNVRSIVDLDWQCDAGNCAGWHVFIGDNGSGKSSLLRAIALAVVGPSEAAALRLSWNDWLRIGQQKGVVQLDLLADDRNQQRAEYTRRVLRLNRDALPRRRGVAYDSYLARLGRYVQLRDDNELKELRPRIRSALARESHRYVWLEMKRQRNTIEELRNLFRLAPETLDW